jgi:ATP-dependent Clp protease ATP-binding subunit ClpA
MLVANHARAVVYHAIGEARRRDKAVVDTGDLLMGLLASYDAVTRAVWREFGISAESLRDVLAAQAHRGATPVATPLVAPTRGEVGMRDDVVAQRPTAFSVGARQVLGRAFTHARAHGARRLGAAHLLLAITAQDDCDRARVLLSALDVDVAALAGAVCRRLSGSLRVGGGHAFGTTRSSSGPSDGLWPSSERSGSR